MTDLNELRDKIHATAVDKGWWAPQEKDLQASAPLLGTIRHGGKAL